jgi:hypothetical protein
VGEVHQKSAAMANLLVLKEFLFFNFSLACPVGNSLSFGDRSTIGCPLYRSGPEKPKRKTGFHVEEKRSTYRGKKKVGGINN